jgi:serine/threonine protein kinase
LAAVLRPPKCDPSLVCYEDVFEIKDEQYLVMRMIFGTRLNQFLDRHTHPLLKQYFAPHRRSITADLVNALETLHQSGYSHGDISLQNMLWDVDAKKVYLIDYGSSEPLTPKLRDVDIARLGANLKVLFD